MGYPNELCHCHTASDLLHPVKGLRYTVNVPVTLNFYSYFLFNSRGLAFTHD